MNWLSGWPFYKMSGSGNDFIFFDSRFGHTYTIETPEIISRLCARGPGIGADGVIILFDATELGGNVGIRYYNSDGSRAALCGNGTLCATSLAVTLGMADPAGFLIATDSGVLQARIRDNMPEFDLPAVVDVQATYTGIFRTAGELRLGYAIVGVPHVVIQVPDVSCIEVVNRGRSVRHHPSLAVGVNVNFVSRSDDNRWAVRTYERGVEDETLACGTGNVATAILLSVWGEAGHKVELVTRSGRSLDVRLRYESTGPKETWYPSLRGEGRLVFRGQIASL